MWKHFLRSTCKQWGQCKRCPSKISCKNTTTALGTHLAKVHGITKDTVDSVTVDPSIPSTSRPNQIEVAVPVMTVAQPKITSYFTMDTKSRAFAIARMAALNGLSLNCIVSAPDIQLGMAARKLSGESHSFYHVRKAVSNMSSRVKELISNELKEEKAAGTRFGLTFDEWTSSNKRFLNVYLRCNGKLHNLGKDK